MKRKLLWAALAVGLLFAAALALGGYKFLRAQRLLWLAQKELGQEKLLQAAFYAKSVWQRYPHNDAALGILAETSQKMGSPEQLLWLGKWCENNPSDPKRKLDFAKAVLATGQLDACAKILQSAEATPGVDTVRLGQLKTALALAKGDRSAAENELRASLAMKPDDSIGTLNLANFLIATKDQAKIKEGRLLLEPLADAPQTTAEAARSLLGLALYEKNKEEMTKWLPKLLDQKQPTLQDLFLTGRALLETDKGLPEQWLQKLTAACPHQADVYAALVWFRNNNRHLEALIWLQTLPAQLQTAPLVRIGRAEILVELSSWNALQEELSRQNWEKAEHFRAAFLQESYLQNNPAGRSSDIRQTLYKTMINSLASSPLDLPQIERFLAQRGWPPEEREQVASEVAERIGSAPILTELLTQAQAARDTHVLYVLAKRLVTLTPANELAKNNLAMYRMLLGRDLETAHLDAQELAKKHPQIPGVQTTLAFALYQQNKNAEALVTISKLPPGELKSSAQALYFALILAKAGKPDEALRALSRVDLKNLLPEEKALFEACKNEIVAVDP